MTEHVVQVNLRIYGKVDGENNEDARRVAQEILQGGLADAGWSSEAVAPGEYYSVELDGVLHQMPAKIPALTSRNTLTACRSASPTGRYRCSLTRGHTLEQHVAIGFDRTLAIWR